MLNSLDAIRNFVQLTPRIGTAGQPSENQFQLIADAGYKTVINIAMPDHPDSIDHEGKLVTELGMNYLHLPVPFDQPKADHVKQFFGLLQAQSEQPVFVHCIMNYRVSAFMYHYLTLIEYWPRDRARSPMFEQWKIEPQWQAIMDLSADQLGFWEDNNNVRRSSRMP